MLYYTPSNKVKKLQVAAKGLNTLTNAEQEELRKKQLYNKQLGDSEDFLGMGVPDVDAYGKGKVKTSPYVLGESYTPVNTGFSGRDNFQSYAGLGSNYASNSRVVLHNGRLLGQENIAKYTVPQADYFSQDGIDALRKSYIGNTSNFTPAQLAQKNKDFDRDVANVKAYHTTNTPAPNINNEAGVRAIRNRVAADVNDSQYSNRYRDMLGQYGGRTTDENGVINNNKNHLRINSAGQVEFLPGTNSKFRKEKNVRAMEKYLNKYNFDNGTMSTFKTIPVAGGGYRLKMNMSDEMRYDYDQKIKKSLQKRFPAGNQPAVSKTTVVRKTGGILYKKKLQ